MQSTEQKRPIRKASGGYCGNAGCSASSGICGAMTFGYGKLDDYGYWEHPCEICAAVTLRFSSTLVAEYGVWPEPRNPIPDWAGQATPGAQLTGIRSAIENTLLNMEEGIQSLEGGVKSLNLLLEQLQKLEQHLQYKSW